MAKSGFSLTAPHLVVGALVGVGVGVGSLFVAGRGSSAEVGLLQPVYAAPAETSQVVDLAEGRTLGGVLRNDAGLGVDDQQAFLTAFGKVASPRRMKVGTPITLRRWADGSVRAVDVTLDADQTLHLARQGESGWKATKVVTPVTTDTVFVSGKIEDLLWTSVLQNPALADVPALDRVAMIHRLDQVFQWQIDFSRQVRRGDVYRFVFQREVRPDGTMRSGHIVAAEFVNEGTPYYAIWFDPNGDGQGTYYDLQGRSVRRAFLRKPLQFRYISSRFSLHRFHPILHKWRAHTGVDYAAARGTPVMATADGVVVAAGRSGGYGNLVEIRHPNGWQTRYGHLSGFAKGIHVGARVHQGQVVGYVGMTGLATGPHLHYEMRRHGRAVDPLAVNLPPGDPVPAAQKDAWVAQLAVGERLLERTPGPGSARMAATGSGAEAGPSTPSPDTDGGSTGPAGG